MTIQEPSVHEPSLTTAHLPAGADTAPPARRRWWQAVLRWFDTDTQAPLDPVRADRVDWLRAVPFVVMHLMCLGVIWVGWSWFAIGVAAGLYVLRMFAITAFYHRYFSHKTFKASRPVQFVFAAIGASSVQRGPLWWAAHHRHHHRVTDTPEDPHSPGQHGFWWSHMGWFLTPRGFRTNWDAIPDLRKFPELRFLDRFDILLPVLLAGGLFLLGGWLEQAVPQLGTSAGQLLIWGFFVSTVVLFHATVTINSLSHTFGSRRFDTRDDSRNNWMLALLTFGEGWHNNHHYFPGSARQGFRWWEVDLTWYGLKMMSWIGLVRDLKPVPAGLIRTKRSDT
jgi:stearoyl-CoA desaturase (delta-9 desaturase)